MNKKILTISGSSRSDSSNVKLLKALALLDSRNEYILYDGLSDIPLFAAEKDCHPWSQKVLEWRSAIKNADAVIAVVAQVPLHQDQIKVVDGKIEGDKEILEMLTEVLGML